MARILSRWCLEDSPIWDLAEIETVSCDPDSEEGSETGSSSSGDGMCFPRSVVMGLRRIFVRVSCISSLARGHFFVAFSLFGCYTCIDRRRSLLLDTGVSGSEDLGPSWSAF